MAITNAQQYKQLVNPPMKGNKRPGYRGDAAARSTGAAQSGRADPGPRGDPGEGRASKGSGVSEATGGFAPTKGVGAGVGPTGRDDLVRQSLLNQAKEFRTQQQEKRKGLNLLERFRVNRLKKLFERKNLPQFKYAPIGIELFQSLTPTQLSFYESTSEDDLMDTGYGMTGEDLTDSDRIADAINKAESTGVITNKEFEDAFFGPGGKPTVDDRDGPQDPCRGPNPPAYCFTGIRSAAPVVEEEPEYVNPLSKLTPRIAGTQFAAEGGRIGLRGGGADMGAADRAQERADRGYGDTSGPDDRSTKGQTAINDAAIMMAKMQNQNLDSITNPKFTEKFSKINPMFSNFNKMALDKMIADANLNTVEEEEDEDLNESLAGFIRNQPAFQSKIDATVSGVMDNPDIANLGKTSFAGGGIASLDDMDREAFLLGGVAKGLKKAVKGIKKLAKSPIGKAALGFAAFQYGPQLLSGKGFGLGTAKKFSDLKFFGKGANVNPFRLAGIPAIFAGAMTPKEDKDKFDIDSDYASGQTGDVEPFPRIAGSKFDFYGSRIASAEGGSTEKKEPVAKKTMPLLDMDGMEKDYREDGGFVPIGRMEKADDVPARLSKNEFVFTADAVRNAGDGDVDKGAEVMYNMMKNLESGGDVSEESQGLEGARNMFQTSKRLEEVI